MSTLAETTIEKLSAPEYAGDLTLAYLINQANTLLGRPAMTVLAPYTEETLRHDIKVVLALPAYADDAGLAELLAA